MDAITIVEGAGTLEGFEEGVLMVIILITPTLMPHLLLPQGISRIKASHEVIFHLIGPIIECTEAKDLSREGSSKNCENSCSHHERT